MVSLSFSFCYKISYFNKKINIIYCINDERDENTWYVCTFNYRSNNTSIELLQINLYKYYPILQA